MEQSETRIVGMRSPQWDELDLPEWGEIDDEVTYCDQVECGELCEGRWYWFHDAKRIIVHGSFGNDNAPGASFYTLATVFGSDEEFQQAKDRWEAKPEWIEPDPLEDE